MRVLLDRYPRLVASLARADLRIRETPVEWWRVGELSLLAKRDDLSAPSVGGNKARALELLLAGVAKGDALLTVGPAGSTHALAVAEHGARLGARTRVVTWPQEVHPVAEATASRLDQLARVTAARSVPEAYVRAALLRLRGGMRWIPAGGSVPLGALGHVEAALELADQLPRSRMPEPDVLVAPLGSGGTVAGLLVGLTLSGLATRIVGVRVVPRIVANRARVLALARRTHRLLEQLSGERLPAPDGARLEIVEDAYGGAYARPTEAARRAADRLRDAGGPRLDPTYSAKAFAVALDRARRAPDERVLFWLTFDARWLSPRPERAVEPPHFSPISR